MTAVLTPENGPLMAEILQFLGAGFRHAAHAFAGIEPSPRS
ncbi:MAG: hypothetical protein ACI9P3_002936 [Bradyrhizobium sp.]|jgi:hypothetical protein